MDNNKENTCPKKLSTRIPLPLDPLPAIPRHLLRKTHNQKQIVRYVRSPLKTVQQHNVPSTSSSKNSTTNCSEYQNVKHLKISRRVLNIDTKYVTLRRPVNDTLEWSHIFKDQDTFNPGVNISDDIADCHSAVAVCNQGNQGSVVLNEVATPIFENRTVKNIKRSLKRPHSRELLGFTPVNQEKKLALKGARKTNFDEKLHERLQLPDFWKRSYMRSLNEYSNDIFEYLLATEKPPVSTPKPPSITRACIINWLVKVNGPNGNPATLQAACWYFDSILGVTDVKLTHLQMVAAACYWVARKLHGPGLLAKTLVKVCDSAFSADMILKTERKILQILNFPLQPVVAQEFITYLAWFCDQENPGEIEVAATFLLLSGLVVDKELVKEAPSVIAVAAVMNALMVLGKREQVSRLQQCHVYTAAEKKSPSLSFVMFLLRRGVKTMTDPIYEYNALLEYYSISPYNIAQKVAKGVKNIAVLDNRHLDRCRDSISFKK